MKRENTSATESYSHTLIAKTNIQIPKDNASSNWGEGITIEGVTGGTGPAGCLIVTSGNTSGGLSTHWFGGDSMFGFGGVPAYASYSQLPNASGYGAGGGGGYNITTGNGSQGIIIVMEYK